MPATAYPSPQDLVERLLSVDVDTRLKALRDVKNQIIGNKTKKLCFIKLGAVPRIVQILAHGTDSDSLVQSAAALGSFACGIDDGVRAVLDSGVLPHLLRTLTSGDSKVVEAGARSLKMIYQSALAPRSHMFEGGTMPLILHLLSDANENVAEVAASVIARCCETREQQLAVANAGGVAGLLRLLLTGSPRMKEAALDALASMTRDNRDVSEQLVETEGAVEQLKRISKDASPRRRLLACMAIAHVASCATDRTVACLPSNELVSILPTVVKLLDEDRSIQEEAPCVLAHLVETNEDLQRCAVDADAVLKLSKFLTMERSLMSSLAAASSSSSAAPATAAGAGPGAGSLAPVTPRFLDNTLMALAALCKTREGARKQLIDSKAFPAIVAAIEDPNAGVRAAACRCIASLSRSVKVLRTSFADAKVSERLAPLLLSHLHDSCLRVQEAASRAICNVVLEFCPLRETLLRAGALAQLVALTQSMERSLRLNAVWALKNLLFFPVPELRKAVIKELTFPSLFLLFDDPEEEIQENALTLLRNLLDGKLDDIDRVLAYENGAVLRLLHSKLTSSTNLDIYLQALYCVSNVAAGSEQHREAIMASDVASLLPRFLTFWNYADVEKSRHIRLAAVWCTLNLAYKQPYVDKPAEEERRMMAAVAARAAKLLGLGVNLPLQQLKDDPCYDLRVKAEQAMAVLTSCVETP
eukprot:jgi/Mesvir1/9886/Mv22416-RA.1